MADEEIRRIFAKKLNHYLAINGYNQADLARYMHVSTATTAKWCTGQTMPRIDKIQSICNWLGLEKTDLLDDQMDVAKPYYLNDDAREFAQFLYENPEYRVLFDASRKVKKQDLEIVKELLDRFS